MKVVCAKCQTRYSLAPDKVPNASVLRLTCKRCGQVMRLRRDPSNSSALIPLASSATLDPSSPSLTPVNATKNARQLDRVQKMVGDIGAPRASASPFDANDDADDTQVERLPPSPPAPLGDATRIFIMTAGLDRRRRRHWVLGASAVLGGIGLVVLVAFDLCGLLALPGMGALYDATGVADPNASRALTRVEAQLATRELSPAERESLRRKLLRLRATNPVSRSAPSPVSAAAPQKHSPMRAKGTTDVARAVSAPSLGPRTQLATEVFADTRKKQPVLQVADASAIQASRLPSGLTAEAVARVVNENSRSMKLCLEEAFKKGDRLTGKMEVEVTISSDGSVMGARVVTPQFRGSALAPCTIKRVTGWRFPRFAGEPVSVVFPYVLSAGF